MTCLEATLSHRSRLLTLCKDLLFDLSESFEEKMEDGENGFGIFNQKAMIFGNDISNDEKSDKNIINIDIIIIIVITDKII